MKKSVKKKWVAALESGEYKRGTSRLRKPDEEGVDRFCCLGVLCDISGIGDWGVENAPNSARSYVTENGADYTMPTTQVTRWAGLDERTMNELAMLNDSIDAFADETYAVVLDKIKSL